MSAIQDVAILQLRERVREAASALDARSRSIVERKHALGAPRTRGWFVRRMLLAADIAGLLLAFVLVELVTASAVANDAVGFAGELVLFVLALPAWVVAAKVAGLYDSDEARTDHSTADEVMGVVHMITLGSWIVLASAWLSGIVAPDPARIALFWCAAVVFVVAGRIVARAYCRRHILYVQNAVIVGAGSVGHLVARKLLHHPEYGINLLGFIDADPRPPREELEHVAVLGGPERLAEIVELFDVERVIVAFSSSSVEESLELIRQTRKYDLQIDLVPRLFEVVNSNVEIHTLEGLPLVGLPPVRLSPSSRLLKRTVDVVGASVGLLVTAPLFAYCALRIKLDSSGPIFFRQTRLGVEMREFTMLKFRTMRVDTDAGAHRDYVRSIMSADAAPNTNGLYKLDQPDATTRFGRWLRKTSLDELPQLINVLRGDMSLVGPRPCLAYELEGFAPHHFDRFLVPAGITGLWQVIGRARTTFLEALEMDVAYARGWSLGLDIRILLRTPLQLLRRSVTA